MNPIATIRQRQIPWARRALAVFVIVWANMALAPCVMAFDAVHEHDCAQYPSGDLQSCDVPAVQDISCDAAAAECGVYDEYNYDGRTVQAKVKHTLGDGTAAITSSLADIPSASPTATAGFEVSTQQSGIPIPLNILYCVYLH